MASSSMLSDSQIWNSIGHQCRALSPMVSVIVPCFNHGAFLPETVASVCRLGRDDVELIVVDDGSTDADTRESVNEIASRGVTTIRQANQGLAAARNAAIAAARGRYVVPLDADDRLRPAAIEHGVRILNANPEVGVVYGDAQCFGTRDDRWVTGKFSPTRLLWCNFIHATAIYRRTIWQQVSGYDGTMPVQGYEDWDFWLGALEHGWDFAYVPQIFFDYRQAHSSMITQARGFERAVERFTAKKHGVLYRRAWIDLEHESLSIKKLTRRLGTLVKSRLKGRKIMNLQDLNEQ